MTTAEMVTFVRQKWGQTTANGGGVTDLDIVAYLNDRQKELCSETNVLVSGWTASLVNAQEQYSVPPEYTSVEAIQVYHTTGDMQQEWLDKVDLSRLDPRRAAGRPRQFAVWGLNVSGDNSLAFFLRDIPNNATSNDLYCYGRQMPKLMVSGGQAPEVRERWQYLCCYGALADIYLRLSSGKSDYVPKADRMEAKWEKGKANAAEISTLDLFHPGQVKDTWGLTRVWNVSG